jgi:hypothetical protein
MTLDRCAALHRTASLAANWSNLVASAPIRSAKEKRAEGQAHGEGPGLGAAPRFCAL